VDKEAAKRTKSFSSVEGKLTRDQLRTIIKSSFYQFWLEAFSIPQPVGPDDHHVQIEIHGMEHLQGAKSNGKVPFCGKAATLAEDS
jgi:hypothetical protein